MTIFFELGYLLIALASAFDLINFTENTDTLTLVSCLTKYCNSTPENKQRFKSVFNIVPRNI